MSDAIERFDNAYLEAPLQSLMPNVKALKDMTPKELQAHYARLRTVMKRRQPKAPAQPEGPKEEDVAP